MLSSLEIGNFKGIKSGKIGDLAQVNILVGRNNSGKSTVLDALLLMRCAFAVTDHIGQDGQEQVLVRRIDRRTGNLQVPDLREMYHRLDNSEQISLACVFTDGAQLFERWPDPHTVDLEPIGPEMSSMGTRNFGVGKGLSVYELPNRPWQWAIGYVDKENVRRIAPSFLMDTSTLRGPFLERIWGNTISG